MSNAGALLILKLSRFCLYFMPLIPVITLVYLGKGVSLADFFLIQGIFRIAAFLFEIPSGYLADVFSRKKIMVLAALLQFLGMLLLIWAQGFWAVVVCESLMGMASALLSGTGEAYVYDLLKREGKENQYIKENGSIKSFAQAGTFVSMLLGGVLLARGGNVLLGVEALVVFFGFVLMLFLPEIKEVRRKVVPEASPLKDCLGIVKMSVKHPEIKWLMLFPAIYSTFTIVLLWLLQPAMELALVPVALFGVFFAVNQGSRVLFSKFAHKILNAFGAKRLLVGCVGALVLGFSAVLLMINSNGFMMPLVYAICGMVAIIPAVQTMCVLVFNDYIHHRIQSNERGTVLSVSSMFNMGISGAVLMAAKPLLSNFGVEITSFIFLVLVVLILIPLNKVFKIKNL